MKTTGTCGACFRKMSLGADGLVVRHGWRETSGKRRVGSYGNVSHTGACFGVGWLPFEVSPDCTSAFVERRLFPMGVGIKSAIARLATRPALIFQGTTYERNTYRYTQGAPDLHRDNWNGYAVWEVRLVNGDAAVSNPLESVYGKCKPLIPSYSALRVSRVDALVAEWEAVAGDALYCCSKVSGWKLSKVSAAAKNAPVVHALNPRCAASRGAPLCKMMLRGGTIYRIAQPGEKVTCVRCAKRVAERAAREVKAL